MEALNNSNKLPTTNSSTPPAAIQPYVHQINNAKMQIKSQSTKNLQKAVRKMREHQHQYVDVTD